MAKRKKKVVEQPEPAAQPKPEEVKTPAINPGVSVKAINFGNPFPCDLSAWGYGYKWPSGAVYTIPMGVYLDLLKKGMNGAEV
jgi:hypothetical protein